MSDAVGYARLVNNLPKEPKSQPLGKRILTSKWTWITIVAIGVYSYCVFSFFSVLMEDVEVQGGKMPGINASALRQAAWYATPTLLFWILVFLIVDRFRPQRPLLWFLSLGWGASVAVWVSFWVNTYAAAWMNVTGDGDPASQARPAVFIAPFVEESAKATVLFWLAILVRYRLVSRVSLISLGGLSAAGFAFTENILYYAQVIFYATRTIGVGDAAVAISETVRMRGFFTCFGHPLFTVMTGIGLAIGLRARSKLVRILAPLAGFLLAAGLHMLFNSQASQDSAVLAYFMIGIPLVLAVVIYAVRQILAQG
ncbi:MAG: PrsW family intramembrane metalloprotease, partial [Propionibacteriaceae bacterium]|nr:PrsW family intramembrane metalloprotease [Propionibacteriaceae bacterium]